MTPVDTILYHANCYDGSMAAGIALRHYPEARCIPVAYQTPIPIGMAGRHILIVDFSYPRQALIDLATIAASVTVLDHHKSARDDLAGLNQTGLTVVFDMTRSGAGITWDFLNPGIRRPMMVNWIEDGDTHAPDNFSLANTALIRAALQTFDYVDIPAWMAMCHYDQFIINRLLTTGQNLIQIQEKQIGDICRAAYLCELGGYVIPIATGPLYRSEVTHRIGSGYVAGAAIYTQNDGKYVYRLTAVDMGICTQCGDLTRATRTADGLLLKSAGPGHCGQPVPLFDVSILAKTWGGGGHSAAAGFSSKSPKHVYYGPYVAAPVASGNGKALCPLSGRKIDIHPGHRGKFAEFGFSHKSHCEACDSEVPTPVNGIVPQHYGAIIHRFNQS